jgi:5-methylcytosine-specific restriction endonuclease McrA
MRKLFFTDKERDAHKKEYMKKYRQDNKEKLYARDKEKTQERRKKHKKLAVEYLGSKCQHCGLQTDKYCVYDFHHVVPENKKADPGSLLHYSWKRLQEELDKCILLCANCHRIEHDKDNNEQSNL